MNSSLICEEFNGFKDGKWNAFPIKTINNIFFLITILLSSMQNWYREKDIKFMVVYLSYLNNHNNIAVDLANLFIEAKSTLYYKWLYKVRKYIILRP